MTVQPAIHALGALPGPSSQTTSVWPLVRAETQGQVMGQGVGHDVRSPSILAPRDTRDRLIEEILTEFSEAWERLADL